MIGNPFPLKQNAGKSFQGSIVLGKGFVLSPEEAEALIAKDPRNKDVLFPYLNGDDLNNDPEQKPSRWVINFFDWPEEKARTYPDCFEIVEKLVKPERDAYDESKNSWNKSVKANWWLFGAWRKALDKTISQLDQVMAISEVTKYVSFTFVPTNLVFMHTLKIMAFPDWINFSLLSSSIYSEWSWKYSSTMGSGTLRFTPSTCFETFPFLTDIPDEIKALISDKGQALFVERKALMESTQLGITKFYNQFHNQNLRIIPDENLLLEEKLFEKQYGKDCTLLKRQLNIINNSKSYNKVVANIEKLRLLQVEVDYLLLQAYKWNDVQLKHDFYSLEYLPEGDRVRFTINPDARREILTRLLKLNHTIYQRSHSYIS